MTAAKQLIDMQFLRTLVPLGDLNQGQLQRLMGSYTVELVESGKEIFTVGEQDPYTFYLLSGQIQLRFRSGSEREVKAQTTQARYALVPECPRTATATTLTTCTVLKVERTVLEELLQWDDRRGFEVNELESGKQSDWMTRYLQSKVFLKLRAQNIQALMMRLEEIPVRAGQVIIRQGDDDGYYYIIKKGHCQVTRRNAPQDEEKEMAVLTVGTGFGEEAIITHSRRGATVTMLDNGYLMRLSRSDFRRLLVDPLIEDISFQQAIKLDNVVFLDVRAYDEYLRDGIQDADHIALIQIRPNMAKFELDKIYICYSDNVYSASAAAFLLCQQGINSVVLRGGMNGIPATTARGNRPDDDIPIVANVVTLNYPKQTPREEELPDDDYDMDEVLQDPRVQALFVEKTAADPAAVAAVLTPASQYNTDKVMEDPRVQALFDEARHRVLAQSDIVAEADAAKRVAEEEVSRLRREAERAKQELLKARNIADLATKQSTQQARLQASREAAHLRELELGAKQAEMEEAVRQAEEEAQRAQDAELGRLQAEQEIENLKQQMSIAVANAKQEAQQSAEIIKQFIAEEARKQKDAATALARREAKRAEDAIEAQRQAQAEIEYLKAQAQTTRMELEQQAKQTADEVRRVSAREVERVAEQHRQREMQSRQAAEAELDQMRDELAKSRAEAEAARVHGELQLEQLRVNAKQESQRQQVEALQAAEKAREQGIHETKLQNAQVLKAKQAEIDCAIREAEYGAQRALAAERARDDAIAQINHLRSEANDTQNELQSQLSDDIARSEIEHEVARARAIELANKQAEIEEITRHAEEESARARMAESARSVAEREVGKLKEEMERMRQAVPHAGADLADNAAWKRQHEADIARKESEILATIRHAQQEAERARSSESAFDQAKEEIKRLRAEMEVATLQAKAQLEEDIQRASAQQAELERKAHVLAQKQAEIASAVERAELEKLRAEEADRARKEAEYALTTLKKSALDSEKVKQELSRIQADAREKDHAMHAADKRAAREAARAEQADRARKAAELEIKRLKQLAIAQHRKAEQAIKASMKTPTSNGSGQPRKPTADKKTNPQWISDQVLWETTLGMRSDDEVSNMLTPDDAFDEMKETLLTDIPLVPRRRNEPDPVMDEPIIYQSSVERSAFRARDLTPGVSPQSDARAYLRRRPGMVKSLLGIVILSLAIGGGVMYISMSGGHKASGGKTKLTGQAALTDTVNTKSEVRPSTLPSTNRGKTIEERVLQKRYNSEAALRRDRVSAEPDLTPTNRFGPPQQDAEVEERPRATFTPSARSNRPSQPRFATTETSPAAALAETRSSSSAQAVEQNVPSVPPADEQAPTTSQIPTLLE